MSVTKDASGRRSVQVEVEVPGTPEEVWQAIATASGVSSWFVPTEERNDGTIVSHFGPGMDSVATKTAWDPPHRFAGESREWCPNAPPLATEWIVEARSGGTCLVRVVHSLFASSDEWDNQLEGIEAGWPDYFCILQLYLKYFSGQRCSSIQLLSVAPAPASKAWDVLSGALGFADATLGQRRKAPASAPPLAGLVERTGERGHPHQLLLRLDEPTPGIVHLFALGMGSQVVVVIRLYLYGDQAPAAAQRDEPLWQTWMNDHFPALGTSSNVA
jgi:uncharacterized protein YndB with AHSA1/START domain